MERSSQQGKAESIETLHLSPNENTFTIVLINIYHSFYMTPKDHWHVRLQLCLAS